MGLNLLQKKIQEASQKYYTEGDSGVSDKQFDEMLDTLKKEDPTNPLVTDVGHGYKVDEDTTPGEKVKHRYGVAGSLDKCHDWKEFKSDLEVAHRYASLKLDGLSIVMYYEKGELVRALTRGDGVTGITITDKVLFIHPEYESVHPEFTGAVRGEAVMSHENFEKFKELHPDAKNARNSTAGLINGKELTEDLKFIDIVVYRVVGMTTKTDKPMCTYTHVQQFLRENFSRVAPWEWVELTEGNFIEAMEILKDKWYSIYPADGIVLTCPNVALRHTGMKTSQGPDIEAVYTSNAFKFKAESAITKVIGVEWNLSKTRYLIPRIQMETVQLSGTNVSWCAGNNAENIEKLGVGPGAEIEVLKSGEIIPYLEQIITPAEHIEIPTHCPECGTELERCGVHLMCPNLACANAEMQDLLVWMDNIAPYDGLGDTLKLKFLNDKFDGEPTIEKIYQEGPVMYLDSISGTQMSNFYEMYSQLFTNKVKLCDAVRALNIPRFGEVTSRKLAQYPEQIITLIYAAENPHISIHPDGFDEKIGEANYKSMMENLWKFKRLAYIKENIDWTGEPKDEVAVKVAITGKLSVKRSSFEQELRDAGYVPGSISKDTCFLITDDPTSSSDKNKKADEWGIEKITEVEFRQKYLNR